MTTHWSLGGDAADPQRLASFWALALGYVDEPGYDFADGASLVDPDGVLPAISFVKVPEGKTRRTGSTSTYASRESRLAPSFRTCANSGSAPRWPSSSPPARPRSERTSTTTSTTS